MQIEQALIAARSPWQNPYVERVIGSICRECLDPVNVLNERHLRRILPTMLPTITHRGRTLRPPRIPARSSRPIAVRSSRFPKSADCIIGIRAARPEPCLPR
jgi:hypothetical protein